MALALLSGMSVADLTHAIATQESARLTRIPGIGKKTAERLLLELKGKFGSVHTHSGVAPTNHETDILQALTALGYSEKESLGAIKSLPPDIDVAQGIRHALKSLAR